MNDKRRCFKRKELDCGDVYLNRLYCLIITIYRREFKKYETKVSSINKGNE